MDNHVENDVENDVDTWFRGYGLLEQRDTVVLRID